MHDDVTVVGDNESVPINSQLVRQRKSTNILDHYVRSSHSEQVGGSCAGFVDGLIKHWHSHCRDHFVLFAIHNAAWILSAFFPRLQNEKIFTFNDMQTWFGTFL